MPQEQTKNMLFTRVGFKVSDLMYTVTCSNTIMNWYNSHFYAWHDFLSLPPDDMTGRLRGIFAWISENSFNFIFQGRKSLPFLSVLLCTVQLWHQRGIFLEFVLIFTHTLQTPSNFPRHVGILELSRLCSSLTLLISHSHQLWHLQCILTLTGPWCKSALNRSIDLQPSES